MILYHASNISVTHPDTAHSRDYLDFGKGFYLTSIRKQAESYAQRFLRRRQNAWLCIYDLNFNPEEWNILTFDSYDQQWLRFISNCRNGLDDTDYDIVIGGVANDKVILTLDRYFNGELSEELALGLLKYEKPNNQICIRNQSLLDKCLTHLESIKL